jgi:hypothetical protein
VLVKQNRKGNRGNKNPVSTNEKISRKVRRKNAFEQVQYKKQAVKRKEKKRLRKKIFFVNFF